MDILQTSVDLSSSLVAGSWVDCLRHSTGRLEAIMYGIVFLPAQHSADLLNLTRL